ncbi:MAG: tRNA lysidine(34) synthetase TilS [Candidatus Acidiferrales bacterium]
MAHLSREEEGFWTLFIEDRYRLFVKARGKRLTIRIQNLLLPLELSVPILEGAVEPRNGRHKPLQLPKESAFAERTVTKRLIRRLYEGVRGDRRELTATHVDQVVRLASESASGSRIELPGGVIAERSFDELVFLQLDRAEFHSAMGTTKYPAAYQYVMELPEHGTRTLSVPELGSRFHLKMIDWSFRERDTRLGEAFDADLLRSGLMLRNWRAGDSYRPLGCRHDYKLKRLFLTRRIPRVERSLWPVIESGGNVVWARGMPPAGDFCAGENTRMGVVIEEDRDKE